MPKKLSEADSPDSKPEEMLVVESQKFAVVGFVAFSALFIQNS